ncbi:hypothetical protein DFP72DRAFT_814028, partial [Ephemerocybe angulata]
MQQPNRNFVRVMIITERRFRFVHFDRSGLYVSMTFKLLNLHTEARTFVRLVLGLTSSDETVLGFDPSIKITKRVKGKIYGTIETVDEQGVRHANKLIEDEAPFIRNSIRGRGTTCWYAYDPVSRQRVVIKDSWRTEGRQPEGEYLKVAKGVDGVAEMLHYEDRLAETKHYRPVDVSKFHSFFNHIKSRVVMKHYGKPIFHFTSRAQALYALRDAIVGHHNLFLRRILHRDPTFHNILLGNAKDRGNRGVLIDLDMAIQALTEELAIGVDKRTGARRFQSVAILNSLRHLRPPAQDYLDDLESFLYIL